MAIRRKPKKPRIRPPPSPQTIVEAELAELDVQIIRTNMELLDVLTDVTTPEGSEGEDEHYEYSRPAVQLPSLPIKGRLTLNGFMNALLNVKYLPSGDAPFEEIYRYPSQRKSAARKIAKMKKLVNLQNVMQAMTDPRFFNEMARICEQYGQENHRENRYEESGQRNNIIELVALYCYFDELKKEESESEDDDLYHPIKKLPNYNNGHPPPPSPPPPSQIVCN